MMSAAVRVFQRRPDLVPSLAVAASSALWGLFWIPMRAINDAGVSVAWSGPVVFLCVVTAFLPFALWRWRNFLKSDAEFWIACGLAGLAFTLYAASFNLTDVVRAMLLFYLSPVWSTILGVLVLGERLTVNRVLAVGLGLGGLVVVLGGGNEFPWPRGIGDWFALASGFAWALASVRFFQGGAALLFEKTYGFGLCALVSAVVIAVLPFDMDSTLPDPSAFKILWPWLMVVTVFLLPALFFVIWPATVLSPVRVGILFMTEAVVGVVSAALLTDETFGFRELTGTLMIMGAGAVELIRPQPVKTDKQDTAHVA